MPWLTVRLRAPERTLPQAPLLVNVWTILHLLLHAWEAVGRDLSHGALLLVESVSSSWPGQGSSATSDGLRPVEGADGLPPHPPVELDGHEWTSIAARVALLAHEQLGKAARCLDDGGTDRHRRANPPLPVWMCDGPMRRNRRSTGLFLQTVLHDFVEARGEEAEIAVGQVYVCLCGGLVGDPCAKRCEPIWSEC